MSARTIGSLFSGIGGLELGLERSGLGKVEWQCEIDPFCRRVLAKHWPEVHCYGDIRTCRPPSADILCGGFPCTDLSDASHGKGKGLDGDRSGLWFEFARHIDVLRPRWVIVENVAGAATKRYVSTVRGDLFNLRYASVSIQMRADQVGAPYRGTRIFTVAKAYRQGESVSAIDAQMAKLPQLASVDRANWGRPAPESMGVVDGLPNGLHRVRSLGNAVVPRMAEVIGNAIVASEKL